MCDKCDWQKAMDLADHMLYNPAWDWATDFLEDVLDWIQSKEHVTPKQFNALKNIYKRAKQDDEDPDVPLLTSEELEQCDGELPPEVADAAPLPTPTTATELMWLENDNTATIHLSNVHYNAHPDDEPLTPDALAKWWEGEIVGTPASAWIYEPDGVTQTHTAEVDPGIVQAFQYGAGIMLKNLVFTPEGSIIPKVLMPLQFIPEGVHTLHESDTIPSNPPQFQILEVGFEQRWDTDEYIITAQHNGLHLEYRLSFQFIQHLRIRAATLGVAWETELGNPHQVGYEAEKYAYTTLVHKYWQMKMDEMKNELNYQIYGDQTGD
jgi:hypothetical protein